MNSGRYRRKTVLILVVCTVTIAVLSVLGAAYYPANIGAQQPIAFSHRVHAGDKQIGCLMCHPFALDHAVAGLPPVETCMLCHGRIIIHYPEIQKLRRHHDTNEPIWWIRVSNLPDLVHFDHSMHLSVGVDCGHCHGDVKAMDRIVLPQKLTMGFCIQCHREYGGTRDCLTCHY
jgi:hypothetical protein